MIALEAPARVGAEFLGLARRFRDGVRVEDHAFDAAVAAITKPLRARLMRHPKLRHEHIASVDRLYRLTIPSTFRVGELTIVKDRVQFAVSERRICVSWLRDDAWGSNSHREVGVAVCRFSLSVVSGKLREDWQPGINISLHALARRIERGVDRSHAALVRDLSALAAAGDEDGERVDTPPDGFWLGGMINALDGKRPVRLRHVRTWLPA